MRWYATVRNSGRGRPSYGLGDDAGKCSANHPAAWVATASSVPGSSNRWVAPGTISSLLLAAQLVVGLLVEIDHAVVEAADQQQRRRRDLRSACSLARSGRPPRDTTARVSVAQHRRRLRARRPRRCWRQKTRAADSRVAGSDHHPARRIQQALRQQCDIEALGVIAVFFRASANPSAACRRRPGAARRRHNCCAASGATSRCRGRTAPGRRRAAGISSMPSMVARPAGMWTRVGVFMGGAPDAWRSECGGCRRDG